MGNGIPNRSNYANQASNSGPLSRRAQSQKKNDFSNLFLKENPTQKQEVEDAVFRTVGKIVNQPKLGENPHQVDSFKYSRNSFHAREAMKANDSVLGKKVDDLWKDKSAQNKSDKTKRSFVTLDNDPIKSEAPAAESIQETISKLEARVARLEEQVVQDRFTSNPKVSFPEAAIQSKNLGHTDANYQAHGKSYSSMIQSLGNTTNRIASA
jgi:hypothetical protein